MADYSKHWNRRSTPQTEPVPGRSDMIRNDEGGYGFEVDDWNRLDRFLVLGSEGGSYYVKEQKLTRENATLVEKLIKSDGPRVVSRVREISFTGRAPKNDPALFVLSLCFVVGDDKTKHIAHNLLNDVARIGTHLFQFAQFASTNRGWGRALREAVKAWYLRMDNDKLALQLVKYQQRGGWSHRDLLRLSHPKTADKVKNSLFHFATQDKNDPIHPLVKAHKMAQVYNTEPLTGLIKNHQLPWESIPSEKLNEPEVLEALLRSGKGMPMTAMIRHLPRFTQTGLLKGASNRNFIVDRLVDADQLRMARIHPLQILVAMRTYASGKGLRGKGEWVPVHQIVDALDQAFDLSFHNVKPTGQRYLLGVDVSSSMTWGQCSGMPILPSEAAAAMAMQAVRTETESTVMAFAHDFRKLPISARMRLDDVLKTTTNISFGGTDCALPMQYALKNKLEVDTFVVYTDSETWAGRSEHPFQALQKYRDKMGIPARLAVVAFVSSTHTIADPKDSGMMDIVGFDAATPSILSQFSEGKI